MANIMSAFTEEELVRVRLECLLQACRDDKGLVPQSETISRAEEYFQFLVKPKESD